MIIEKTYTAPSHKKTILWLKKLGLAGFVFFLAKGLLWIAAFVVLGVWGLES